MRAPLKGIVAVLLFCSAAAHGTEVRSTTAVPMDRELISIRAHRLDRSAADLELRIPVPGVATVPLPDGVWELRLSGGNFWAPRVYARDSDAITLPVWPAFPLHGTAAGVTKLSVTFAPLDRGGVTGSTECDVADAAWTCAIPRGQYDLQFSTPGSAPDFRWNVTVPGNLEAPLQFVRGASLSGRLEAARGMKISLDGLEILLAGAQRRYTARSNARGFFQFKGLPPGQYSLSARREGLAARGRSVTILGGVAAELDAPLLLDRPKNLTVLIAPPLDPELKPWRVSLSSYDAGRGGRTAVSESAATPAGEWMISGLVSGDYDIDVSRENGGLWKSADVSIGETDVQLPLLVMGEHVSGSITLGDRPLAATLSFGGEHGATLTSDDDGRFEGVIPPAESDNRRVHVEAPVAGIARTVHAKIERTEAGARVDIKLPATLLTGSSSVRMQHPGATLWSSSAVIAREQFTRCYQKAMDVFRSPPSMRAAIG